MSSHFPNVENVETPLGAADDIWATSSTHIGMRGTFEINRVRYRVRLDLHFRDGEWKRGHKDGDWSSEYHALMIDREWDYPKGKRPDTSASARHKAEDALVPWLAAFAVGEGAEIVHAAGVQHHAQLIESKREQIAKLRAEIETAEQELAALSAE